MGGLGAARSPSWRTEAAPYLTGSSRGSRGISRGSSRSRSRGRSRGRSSERNRERSMERSRERHRDRSREKKRDRSMERNRERNRDRSMERSRERSRERHRDRSMERSKERGRERHRVRSMERSRERSRDRSMERSRERNRERHRDRSMERSRERHRERHRDRSMERSMERHRNRSMERSRERHRDRSMEGRGLEVCHGVARERAARGSGPPAHARACGGRCRGEVRREGRGEVGGDVEEAERAEEPWRPRRASGAGGGSSWLGRMAAAGGAGESSGAARRAGGAGRGRTGEAAGELGGGARGLRVGEVAVGQVQHHGRLARRAPRGVRCARAGEPLNGGREGGGAGGRAGAGLVGCPIGRARGSDLLCDAGHQRERSAALGVPRIELRPAVHDVPPVRRARRAHVQRAALQRELLVLRRECVRARPPALTAPLQRVERQLRGRLPRRRQNRPRDKIAVGCRAQQLRYRPCAHEPPAQARSSAARWPPRRPERTHLE
jgi:hypothetical protein